jgi:hypothetical protein
VHVCTPHSCVCMLVVVAHDVAAVIAAASCTDLYLYAPLHTVSFICNDNSLSGTPVY